MVWLALALPAAHAGDGDKLLFRTPKLGVADVAIEDADGDGIVEAGEPFSITGYLVNNRNVDNYDYPSVVIDSTDDADFYPELGHAIATFYAVAALDAEWFSIDYTNGAPAGTTAIFTARATNYECAWWDDTACMPTDARESIVVRVQ